MFGSTLWLSCQYKRTSKLKIGMIINFRKIIRRRINKGPSVLQCSSLSCNPCESCPAQWILVVRLHEVLSQQRALFPNLRLSLQRSQREDKELSEIYVRRVECERLVCRSASTLVFPNVLLNCCNFLPISRSRLGVLKRH